MTKVDLKELLQAGAHFGHKTHRWHPKMRPFIFTKKDGIHIIDLVKTREALEEAQDFVKEQAKEGKIILFVGTKKQAKDILQEEAERAGMPYVSERWMGGILTNFSTLIRQTKRLKKLEEEKKNKELLKYTKKEQLEFSKELEKLEKNLGGVRDMTKHPDVIYIIDTVVEKNALSEAKNLGIPVVGLVDSNADPSKVDYPIPCNDDATSTIKIITKLVADAVLDGKSKTVETKEAPTSVEGEVGKEKEKKENAD